MTRVAVLDRVTVESTGHDHGKACIGVRRNVVTGAIRPCPYRPAWDLLTRCDAGHETAGPYCAGHKESFAVGRGRCRRNGACGRVTFLVVATPLGGGS